MLKPIAFFIFLCISVTVYAQKQIFVSVNDMNGKKLSVFQFQIVTTDTFKLTHILGNKYSVPHFDSSSVSLQLDWKEFSYTVTNIDTDFYFLEFYIDTVNYCKQFFVAEREGNDCNVFKLTGNISVNDIACYNFLAIHKCNGEYRQKYYIDGEMRGYNFIQMPEIPTKIISDSNGLPANYENTNDWKIKSPK